MAAPPTDDDWKKMSKLVDQFYNRADAEPFRQPVGWRELGLTDYPKIISEPMDLGTIRDKLKKKSYKTLLEVGRDVSLVWNNCVTYNADGSDFFKLATSLNKKWDDKFSKLLSETNQGGAAGLDPAGSADPAAAALASSNQKTTLTERRNFAKSLYTLTKEDLGKVLVEVEAKCPAAITRNSTEDEVMLNVDKITARVLADLTQFVAQQKTQSSSKKKMAPGGGGTKKAKTK